MESTFFLFIPMVSMVSFNVVFFGSSPATGNRIGFSSLPKKKTRTEIIRQLRIISGNRTFWGSEELDLRAAFVSQNFNKSPN